MDRPPREIYFGWSRIYGSLSRQPPGDTLEVGDDFFTLADSYTLADDLTFERSNPDSVWSCFALGRENARQMRHCISAEMWTRLNLAYLRIQKLSIQDIWGTPESFYDETVAEIATFAGVAATTMYRDQGWSFLQLGRFIERARLSTSLLLTQIEADSTTAEESEADWTSLLRAYHAFEAYDRSYSVEVRPRQVLDLLATDPMLPDSLCRSLDMVSAELGALGPGPDADASADGARLSGRRTSPRPGACCSAAATAPWRWTCGCASSTRRLETVVTTPQPSPYASLSRTLLSGWSYTCIQAGGASEHLHTRI